MSNNTPQYTPQVLPKNPALALIASFFVPGLGSLLVGRVGVGIGIMACYFVSWLLTFLLIGFLFLPIVWIWGMVDGYLGAKSWNLEHGIVS